MGVAVVVANVVLVVAAGWNQAVQQGLEVVDTAGLVLHRRYGHGRARGKRRDDAALDTRRPDNAEHARGDVDDVAVARRLHPQDSAVDGHRKPPSPQTTRRRTKRRRPTWSNLPSTESASRSSTPSPTGSPSSRTPPWARARRASEVEMPNACHTTP